MIEDKYPEGYLFIENEEERLNVARSLLKQGYTVQIRRRKTGKSFRYYVYYNLTPRDIPEDGNADES